MLKNKEKYSKEDFLTGFSGAFDFLMEILFFYGTGTLMHGFWQGITGGYLTLFAGMVISGALIFQLLIHRMKTKKEDTDRSRWIQMISEDVLLSVFSLRMNLRLGLLVLAVSSGILIVQKALHGNLRKAVLSFCSYAFILLTGYVILSLFQKKVLALADVMGLTAGTVCFSLDCSRETEKKNSVLEILMISGRDFLSLMSLLSLTPLFYQILQGNQIVSLKAGYRSVIIPAAFSLLCEEILLFLQKKQNTEAGNYRSDLIPVSVTVMMASVFLMDSSVWIGLIFLLSCGAMIAVLFLLHMKNHDSDAVIRMVISLFSHVSLLLVMIVSFEIYDGIHVDYMIVLYAYLSAMAEVFLLEGLPLPEGEKS